LSQAEEVPTPISAVSVSTKEALKEGVGFACSYPMHPITLSRLVFEPNLKYFPQELGDIDDIDIDIDNVIDYMINEEKKFSIYNISTVILSNPR
jgi:hypothetical protein